jgi:hypothetical protein
MLWPSYILLFAFPPVGAAIWWLLSRSWAYQIQDEVSSITRLRQRFGFWALIPLGYLVEFFGWYSRHRHF